MKYCPECGFTKDVDTFYRDSYRKDGRQRICKACRAKYERSEKRKEYSRNYHAQHYPLVADAYRARKRAYMAEYNTRDSVKERASEWAKSYAQREDIAKKKREYLRRYRLTYQQTAREQERSRIKARRRYAVEIGCDGNHTETEWRQMCNLANQRCLACGSSELITEDHVVPLTKGGCDCIHNIQPLCSRCNAGKRNHHATDYRPEPINAWLGSLSDQDYRCATHRLARPNL